MNQSLHVMKQSVLIWVLLYCTSCVLQARSLSYKSTDVNDVLSHLEAEISNHFPPNTTLVDEDVYDALIQLDQLSLVTRYAGLGYNIIRGNPEGDFNTGGIDPGIKTTRVIFAHTYETGNKAFYLGRTMELPDQVKFHEVQSCASSSSVSAFSGRKSYMKELGTSVSAGGSFSSFSFSLSLGMAKVESQTKDQKRIIIQKSKICNYGRVRYLYENAAAREPGYTLSKGFKNSVMFLLPLHYNEENYMQFIEHWGTHIIMMADIGTRHIQRSSSNYKQVYKYLKKKNQFSASGGGGLGGASAHVGLSIKNLNNNIDQKTNLGKKVTEFTIGSRSIPLPIHLDLRPITDSLNEMWWGGTRAWKRNNIDKKQQNLMKALKGYPGYVHAKNNTDPLIRIKLSVVWPDGAYALPKSTWGCPRGWQRGFTVQDTENALWNKNEKSPGIQSKMAVTVNRNNIKFWYCVKTSKGNNISPILWPKGSYCIAKAKKAGCPGGFQKGSIHWDDYDFFNKNTKWGVVPDGSYGHDTTVNYCCRGDGNYFTPMILPTSKPFVLYRFGGKCQRVKGMRSTPLDIKWDDNNGINRDTCSGVYPDTTCKVDQHLHFCYYKKTQN